MKKSRALCWHIFLLLLYPADPGGVTAAAAESGPAVNVAFGEAFSVTCQVENGTVPEWSFNGGKELPKDASVSEEESGDDTLTFKLEVSAANLDNVGEYRDGKFQRHFSTKLLK